MTEGQNQMNPSPSKAELFQVYFSVMAIARVPFNLLFAGLMAVSILKLAIVLILFKDLGLLERAVACVLHAYN